MAWHLMWKLIGEKLGDKDEMDALSDPRPLSRPLEWQTHIKPDAQSNWVRPILKLKIENWKSKIEIWVRPILKLKIQHWQ